MYLSDQAEGLYAYKDLQSPDHIEQPNIHSQFTFQCQKNIRKLLTAQSRRLNMFTQAILTALVALPVLPVLANEFQKTSYVYYYDELPASAYEGDAYVSAYRDIIYLRKDIHYLDPEDGPELSCPSNGHLKLGFEKASALELHELANEKLLGHPLIIPDHYDTSDCPAAANHTILGPKEYVPPEFLAELDPADDFLVIVPVTEVDVKENELILAFIWGTYHQIVGVIGDAPEELAWLEKGVYPWDSPGSAHLEKRKAGGAAIAKAIAKIFGQGIASGATEWALNKVAGGIEKKGSEK